MLSRKDFIKKGLRAAAFTMLASTTGYLLLRKEPEQNCELDFVCKKCNKFEKCSLPEAKEKKIQLTNTSIHHTTKTRKENYKPS